MELRRLPWAKIALAGLAVVLMTSSSPVVFPEKWALARTLHPQAQQRFLDLLNAIEKAGYRLLLTSGYRQGGDDPHGFGLALDCNLVHIKTGQQYGMKVGKTTKAQWEATGIPNLIRSMGFRWGGDFTTPWKGLDGQMHEAYDPVHIDLCGKFPLKVLRPLALKLAGTAANLPTLDKRKVALV